ncbi:MAG TPA: hypothetical protein VKZ50_11880 [bacterium]|nr:hypothetical protein [bacterium]
MWLTKTLVILAHAVVGWALCGAIIAIGRRTTSMRTALIIHAVAVPILFGVLSFVYFSVFAYTTPLQTAAIFVAVAMLLDVVVVAHLIERNFDMFKSVLGTWIPFGLIFASTYLCGVYLVRK